MRASDFQSLGIAGCSGGCWLSSSQQEVGKVLPRKVFRHVSVLGSSHSCRQCDKDLVQHIPLPPQVTAFLLLELSK